jgi:hypothetical protein
MFPGSLNSRDFCRRKSHDIRYELRCDGGTGDSGGREIPSSFIFHLRSAKKSLSGMALATGSGAAEKPAASALPLT